jgi:acetyl esterase/lipase
MHRFYPLLPLFLSVAGICLSVWIVIPAPTFSLLPLGVATPELSPWLLLWNAIALLIALPARTHLPGLLALALAVAGLVLSSLPLTQVAATVERGERTMTQALGNNYLDGIPATVQAGWRSQPIVLADLFRGIATPSVRLTEKIVFAKPDSIPLTLDVYRPEPKGQYPGLVVIYGGAWQRGDTRQNVEFNRYLAARGYVVWAISYRHAPRYRFPAQLQDVQSALAFIRQHASEYETDPQRLAVMGRSAGAHLAMLAAYQPDAIPLRAVINYYGPVDLVAGYRDLPVPDPIDVRAVLQTFLGGTPEQVPEQYRRASPITHVRRSLPPTLLVYGRRDHLVKPEFGRTLHQQLRDAGNSAVFLEIPWAEHAFDAVFHGLGNQLALYYTERFLAWAMTKTPPPQAGAS